VKLLLGLCVCAVTLTAQRPKHLILMSFDGMGYQSINQVPALQALLKKGAHADGVTPHFPFHYFRQPRSPLDRKLG